MNLVILSPRKSLNKAFLRVKPSRSAIDLFRKNLVGLLDQLDHSESEEHVKNDLSGFLQKTFNQKFYINTKDRNDLVIHNGPDARSTVGVLIEAKKPSNTSEMVRTDNLNAKAFHELILYYLRERITNHNLEIKFLVATNIYEWFVFDANLFEKLFAQNIKLIQQFNDFEKGRLAGRTTDFFYKEIATPFMAAITAEICFTWFDFRKYDKPLRNEDKKDDSKLIALFKLLSPEHLLKLPFTNDSNSLDRGFYTELLHIIGLTEIKEGSKKLIERKKEGHRDPGSLIENTILQVESRDKISRLPKPEKFGKTSQERLLNVSIELVITWLNRILFLKLLEAQLVRYHKGETGYQFLNSARLTGYDALDKLFFRVLARKQSERDAAMADMFRFVPYLNSSLFEPTELEHHTIFISNLEDESLLPILPSTVLRDTTGKRRKGKLGGLQYLFDFLDAYDFAGEGSEEIQEDNKTLVNASVLGLIFEKLNGYKDGSFFTPGFITMYMCRETIRRSVVQKFNAAKGWNCEDLYQVYNKIEDRKEANQIINSLKICDPAVGSGHFLVSALNEIIAVKSDLKILTDRDGRRLKEYSVEVVNDELVVVDEDGEMFEYHPGNKESQRIQEALFHEKQTIIENCLFGVDINTNSVKICRLRLWIELLKSAYYKAESNYSELETLPNIDINIKCGNSLISRYALDSDIRNVLKRSKWTIFSYRNAIMTYRNAESKEQKRELERLINTIKADFQTWISQSDPDKIKRDKLEYKKNLRFGKSFLFDGEGEYGGEAIKAKRDKAEQQLERKIEKYNQKLESKVDDKIFENAFEWRFEFPEVLNDKGDFVGFDVVIGNPPYIRQEELKPQKQYFSQYYRTYTGTSDMYVFFVERGFTLLKQFGFFCFIMPNKWMQTGYGRPLRAFLKERQIQSIFDFGDLQVFDEATTYPCILSAAQDTPAVSFTTALVRLLNFPNGFTDYIDSVSCQIPMKDLTDETWIIGSHRDKELIIRLSEDFATLKDYTGNAAFRGILTGLSEAFIINETVKTNLIQEDKRSAELIMPFLLGRNLKPYFSPDPKNWLILIPKGFTIKRNLPESSPYHIKEPPSQYGNMKEREAWDWFTENYPAIAAHLLTFRDKAIKRLDKGDFWWELRACDYYHKFLRPKIMYQKFQVKPCFIYNENGVFCNDSMWIIPSNDKVLLAILNSKMGWWLISKYCTAIQNGYQLIWNYFSQIPIPISSKEQAKKIIMLVDKVIALKKSDPDANLGHLEQMIDHLVYEVYGLTGEEINLVERAAHLTRNG